MVAGSQGELADGHPEPGGEVEPGEVLDVPTSALERGVNVLAGVGIGAPIFAESPAHGDLETSSPPGARAGATTFRALRTFHPLR